MNESLFARARSWSRRLLHVAGRGHGTRLTQVECEEVAQLLGVYEQRLGAAVKLLAKFEYLPYGATVARRVVDGEWITDDEAASACNQGKFTCPTCGWPQGGHRGPGRYKGNATNTHEEGCSFYAVLHGDDAPRIAFHSLPAAHPLAVVEEPAA